MTKKYSLFTAIAIVIANMVGTGVFTSLGYQAIGIQSGFSILMLWVIGGLASLAGALCYAELGAMMPRSGGEYHYLSRIYHPSVGFLSGWVSATIGFAAPVAYASMAMGGYVHSVFPVVEEKWLAAAVVAIITVIHAISISVGGNFQNIFSSLKVIIILVLIGAGIAVAAPEGNFSFAATSDAWGEMQKEGYAVSFFFVILAYSGWNAAAYIASELENPKKNLPRALFWGTAIVTLLYVALNFVMMYVTPREAMVNEDGPVKEIAGVSASYIFGAEGGYIMSVVIAILLISTISSMIIAGPRVTHSMGEDYRILGWLGKKNKAGTPARAIFIQGIISLFFIFTATFDQMIAYVSFTLSLFTFFTVLGVIVMRFREPELERPFKTWGYPVVPAIFLLINGWLLYYGFMSKQEEALAGLGTALIGLVIYFIDKWMLPGRKKPGSVLKN